MCASSVWRRKSGEISIWNLIQMLKHQMFKYFFPGLIFSWYIAVHILFFLQFGENEENRGYYFDYEGLNIKPIYFWRSFSYELGWMLTNDQISDSASFQFFFFQNCNLISLSFYSHSNCWSLFISFQEQVHFWNSISRFLLDC